ncbi:MAG: hypothetical protein SGI72_18545 [Planctomycetota bacterium]|nr:hypothetical protein [Planctomycetota bacterium]
MRAMFETSDAHAGAHLKPLRVPMRADAVFEAVCEQAADMSGWTIQSSDAALRTIVAKRRKRFLSGEATITIRCTGEADLPSTTVNIRSETNGGFIGRDKANVLEFLVPFERRVC